MCGVCVVLMCLYAIGFDVLCVVVGFVFVCVFAGFPRACVNCV